MPKGNRAYEAGGVNTADLRRGGGFIPYDPQMYGGGGDDDMMALAIKLLTSGTEQKKAQEQLELDKEELQALKEYRAAEVGEKQRATGVSERAAIAQEEANKFAREHAGKMETEKLEQRQFDLEQKAKEREFEIISKALESTSLDQETKSALLAGLENLSPAFKTGKEKVKEAGLTKSAGEFKPKVEAAYKSGKPEQVAALAKTIPKDVLEKMDIDWQAANAGLPGPSTGPGLRAGAKSVLDTVMGSKLAQPGAVTQIPMDIGMGAAGLLSKMFAPPPPPAPEFEYLPGGPSAVRQPQRNPYPLGSVWNPPY